MAHKPIFGRIRVVKAPRGKRVVGGDFARIPELSDQSGHKPLFKRLLQRLTLHKSVKSHDFELGHLSRLVSRRSGIIDTLFDKREEFRLLTTLALYVDDTLQIIGDLCPVSSPIPTRSSDFAGIIQHGVITSATGIILACYDLTADPATFARCRASAKAIEHILSQEHLSLVDYFVITPGKIRSVRNRSTTVRPTPH